MNLFNKIQKVILSLFVICISITTLSSCEDWLNVKPSNQVAAEELFLTEEGFEAAISGAYTLMGQEETYAGDMTFNTVDYLGNYWSNINFANKYHEIANYELDIDPVKIITDKMWVSLFNIIANVNDILFYIDDKKDVFATEASYRMIKAEALAIRAYIHLDILRLYAPYTFGGVGDSSVKWLPYVDEYTRNTTLSITNDEFAELLMKDIDDAIALLEGVDPIITETVSDNLFYRDRHFNLNYYAVKALKARAALYFGDKQTALASAQEVIAAQNSTRFRWVTTNEVTFTPSEHRDRTFSSEHIFALYVHNMEERVYEEFVSTDDIIDEALFLHSSSFIANNDFRNYFVSNSRLTKLTQPEKVSGSNLLEQKLKRMPMLRISEMYYIAAECTGVISYINAVRLNRGYEEETPQAIFDKALDDEISAEFMGEGQRFYYYKRINKEVYTPEEDFKIQYTLILPEVEINFGGRPRFELEENE